MNLQDMLFLVVQEYIGEAGSSENLTEMLKKMREVYSHNVGVPVDLVSASYNLDQNCVDVYGVGTTPRYSISTKMRASASTSPEPEEERNLDPQE